ncbi:Acyl-CoA synthetase family member 3, mitochondrial [Papilio machaon]|uniref:Acyl-CoA synthetase family member 3, mitochondrial n=1 Tax=Papilio machaon TaxID=76193 RepID=A0A0N1PKI9_PAPMA|nr:Acyl-CoA synthetase family member 3, mitochondrial [Papilio machaon]
MSEVGMALSNPYRPVEQRQVGCVGVPLPGVTARIATVDELKPLVTVESPVPDTKISLDKLGLSGTKEFFTDSEGSEWKQPTVTIHERNQDDEYEGELLLKGPAVFTRYDIKLSPATPSARN